MIIKGIALEYAKPGEKTKIKITEGELLRIAEYIKNLKGVEEMKHKKANPLVDSRLRPKEEGKMTHFLKLSRAGGKTISNDIYMKGFMDGMDYDSDTKLRTLKELTDCPSDVDAGFVSGRALRKEAIKEIKAFRKIDPKTKRLAVITFDDSGEGVEAGRIYFDIAVIDYIKWKFNITEGDLM